MGFHIEKNTNYAQASVSVIGLTRFYGRPQFFLVNSDEGANPNVKFSGQHFRACDGGKLEDMAKSTFQQQTGFNINDLSLRAVVPSRSRRTGQWLFRNIFLGYVDCHEKRNTNGNKRKTYLADPNQEFTGEFVEVMPFGESSSKSNLKWVSSDDKFIASMARDMMLNYNWDKRNTNWFSKIPCVGVVNNVESYQGIGCGLAVSSMMLLHRSNPGDQAKIILLKRKGDKYPGYAGGKIETPDKSDALNLDPISCCAQEGAEEFGFLIQPRALICTAVTPLNVPNSETSKYYNSIINYAFVAEPTNPRIVEDALRDPSKYLKDSKIEGYHIETLDQHRDRVLKGELRMPDMSLIGREFYRTTPGQKIPLTQILASGVM